MTITTPGKQGQYLSVLVPGVVLLLIILIAICQLFTANSAALPQMAEKPFHLQDGSVVYIQKYEVTVAEWNRCHAAGACQRKIKSRQGMEEGNTPATGINYSEVTQYLAWINQETGRNFRLPRRLEWEEFSAEVLPEKPVPLFDSPSLTWASAYLVENLPPRKLEPSGTQSPTSQGVFDLTGSVWEWTQDCYRQADAEHCPAYYVAGEHQAVIPYLVRDPARGGCAVGSPPAHLGFRLVSDSNVGSPNLH